MVVVVKVRGAIGVINLGGTVLYISTGPVAQLSPLDMGVYPGLEILRYCLQVCNWLEGVSRRAQEILEANQVLR